jgi:hypothetical protein
VKGEGLRVYGLRFSSDFRFWVQGLGLGFRVQGQSIRVFEV